MNKSSYLIPLVAGILTLFSCQPEAPSVYDTSTLSTELIKEIKLKPSSHSLIASEHNFVDLTPLCYIEHNGGLELVAPNKVQSDIFRFYDENDKVVNRQFSTSDPAMIGKTKTFYAKLMTKDTMIVSNKVSIEIVAPQDPNIDVVTIPVIFHLIQTRKEIDELGLRYASSKLMRQLDKINAAFAGQIFLGANGVDTKIIFKPAQYNEKGAKLNELGIDRIVMSEKERQELFNSFDDLDSQYHLIWDVNKYFNICMISDIMNEFNNSYFNLGDGCYPRYIHSTVDPKDYLPSSPELSLQVDHNGTYPTDAKPVNKALFYRIRDLDAIDRSNQFTGNMSNELVFFVGRFWGLLSPNMPGRQDAQDDYCDDTVNYERKDGWYRVNETQYKETETTFFESVNIMDDIIGRHVTVTKDQNKRMRWFLNNATGRQPWQSDFAFTGK